MINSEFSSVTKACFLMIRRCVARSWLEERSDVISMLYILFFLFTCPKEWTNSVRVSIVPIRRTTSWKEAVYLGVVSYPVWIIKWLSIIMWLCMMKWDPECSGAVGGLCCLWMQAAVALHGGRFMMKVSFLFKKHASILFCWLYIFFFIVFPVLLVVVALKGMGCDVRGRIFINWLLFLGIKMKKRLTVDGY